MLAARGSVNLFPADPARDLAVLREAVQAMRDAQRAYFATRSLEALGRSKKAEAAVDALLAGLR